MNRFLLAAGLLLGSWAPAQAQRLVTQTATLAAGQRVNLRLRRAFRIEVHPGDELRVTAHVSLDNNQQNASYALVMEPTPDEVLVTEQLDLNALKKANYLGECHGIRYNDGAQDSRYSYCARIEYEVTVPIGAELHLSTSSADVYMHDLKGVVFVSSESGNITLNDLTGPVVAKSMSGYLNMDSPGMSPLTASSVSGDVRVSWPSTQNAFLDLKTTSGTVTAEQIALPGLPQPPRFVGQKLLANYGSGDGQFEPVQLQATSGNVVFRQVK